MVTKQFGLAWKPIGMSIDGRIVSRQRFIAGSPPTQEEVDAFLLGAGLTPVRQKYWLWKGAEKRGVEPWIGDARADNFVKTDRGLVPIDLRMWNVIVCADAS
jgi:hypothetical protein